MLIGPVVGVWRRAPLQALARLHVLAATDQVDEERLGRPRAGAEVGPRLELLAGLVAVPCWCACRWFGGVKRRSSQWWMKYL